MNMLTTDDGSLSSKSSFAPGPSIYQILEQLESEIDLGLELPITPALPESHQDSFFSPPYERISVGSSRPLGRANSRDSLDFISDRPVRRESGVFSEVTPLLHHERSSKRYRYSVDGANLEALSDNRNIPNRRSLAWRHSSAPLSGPSTAEPTFAPQSNGFPRRSRVVYHGRRFSGLVRSKPIEEPASIDVKDDVVGPKPLELVKNDENIQPTPARVTRHILPKLVIPDSSRRRAIAPPEKFIEGSPTTPVLERSNVLPRIPSLRVSRKSGTVDVSHNTEVVKQPSIDGNTNLSPIPLPSVSVALHGNSHVLKDHSKAEYHPQPSPPAIHPRPTRSSDSSINLSCDEESDEDVISLGVAEESEMFKNVLKILRRSKSQRLPRRKLRQKSQKQEPELFTSPEPVSPLADSSSPISSAETPVSSTTSYSPTQASSLPPREPPAMQPCTVCGDLFDANKIPRAPESRCLHAQTVCRDCSLQWVRTRLYDHGAAAIRCPSPLCSENLTFDDVQSLGCAATSEA